jgi:hypothetical protein
LHDLAKGFFMGSEGTEMFFNLASSTGAGPSSQLEYKGR